jgi:hypothetical protein
MARGSFAGACLVLALTGAGCLRQAGTPVNLDDLVATSVGATLAAQPTATPVPATPSLVTVETPVSTSPPSATASATLVLPSETPTPSTTASPTISATPASGDPRTTLGNPTWRDTFANGNGWNIGTDSFTEAKVEDGKFVLTGLASADGWRLTWPEVKDAYLEATISTATCQSTDEYGLMFRVPDIHDANEGYLFGFTCDGRYFLRTWDGEAMKTLIGSTADPAIQAGSDKTNRIGVWAEGNKLTLYANGKRLAEVEDDAFSDKGGFGFFIGARKTDKFTVEADEIAYWDLP